MGKENLEVLLEKAKKVEMTLEQNEEQRQSFAYGNAAFENPRVTREMVKEEAEDLESA